MCRAVAKDAVTIEEPRASWVLLSTAGPLVGAAVLWAFKAVAGWVASLPAAPWQGWFGLAAGVPEPWATVGALSLGGAAGVAFAAYARYDSLTVEVDVEQLTFTRADETVQLSREEVTAVFLDGGTLVVLGRHTEERHRTTWELDRRQLVDALERHGYPWHAAGDPHAAAYRRWVPGLPSIPDDADVVLRARAVALSSGDQDEQEDLRRELARMGLVVRDEGARQYLRPLARPT